ncbi:MAG: 50S ribosomal protein L33 [Patescibacteria group bacterium]|nr:50S ribosomal protein L33 [Patescibacteria group bacterium]
MSQESLINMECTVCHNLNYQTKKSKGKANPGAKKRLELQKFCKFCKKKTLHKETK